MIQAVITDLAGTTIDFGSCAPAGAFIELFQRHGVEMSWEQARGPMGLEKRAHIHTLISSDDISARWRQAHGGRDWTETDVDELYAEFIPLQLDVLPSYGDLVPGVAEIMPWLRQRNIRVGSTTGYNREMMDVVLKCAGRQGFVPDAASCAEDVPIGRPAPWMIFRCLEALSVFPPAAAVNIGDTLPDIDSGRNAGTWSVGVVRTGNMLGLGREDIAALDSEELARMTESGRRKMLERGAHYVVDGIEQLPELIETINRRMARGDRP